MMLRLSLSILLLLFTLPTESIDLKFRFKDGFCQKNGRQGANPNFFGECGNLSRSRLVHQSVRNQHFTGSILNSSYIYVSHFSGGDMSNTSMQRSILLQSTFEQIKATSLDLRGSHIKGVTFRKANLNDLFANGTRFTRTRFIDCNLQNADFWGSQLLETDFSGSDLSGANFSMTFIALSDFKGAKFNSKTKLPFSQDIAIKKGMIKVD